MLCCALNTKLILNVSNRLKEYLGLLIHKDQSYCVPDSSIVDNLFLIRDVLDIYKLSDVNVGLLSLDQEKAFDRVDHQYLFKTMKAFGFGDVFFTVCWGLVYGEGGWWFELPYWASGRDAQFQGSYIVWRLNQCFVF